MSSTISLVKGENINLTKDNPGLSKVLLGLGWDANDGSSHAFDLDAMLLALKADGKVRRDSDFVYYGNLTGVDGAVKHTGDNLTGAGDGDDEQIKVDLAAVPADIDRLTLLVDIYQAASRGNQNFGQVKNAFIRLVDEATGTEIVRYDLAEDFSRETTVLFADLYRNDGEWKFKALGTGSQDGVAGIGRNHGVAV